MSLGQNNGGISRGGAPGSGGIGGPGKSSSTRKTPSSTSSNKPDIAQTPAQEEELALSGRYGFQPNAQKETIDSNYYNRVQIPISQGQTADARAEMPGIYNQIAQINFKNSHQLPEADTKSNPLDGYDDDNSFGVSLFS